MVSIVFERFLLVKPSTWVVVWFHLMIQWSATVQSPFVESYLPEPWVFALLVHGFPLVTLCGSVILGRSNAKHVFRRLAGELRYSRSVIGRIAFVTAGLIAAFVAIYVYQIGLSNTGLYAIVFDPSRSALAREESLKLISNPFIRYGYAFMASTAAPIAVVSVAILFVLAGRRMKIIDVPVLILMFLGIMMAVSMTGERSHAAKLVLVLILAYFARHRFRFRPLRMTVGVLAVLLIPTMLTLMRESTAPSFGTFLSYFGSILDRVFVGPMRVGLYYVHHAQTTGFFGIAGIPKLASMTGVEAVNASNIIGLEYVSDVIRSISAGGSFVFTYYSYFGLWVFPFCSPAIWLLDLALLVYRRLSDNMLLPCMAAVSASTVAFTAADYTTIMVTHGFMSLLVFAYVLDQVCIKRSLLPIQRSLGRDEGPVRQFSSLSGRLERSSGRIVSRGMP